MSSLPSSLPLDLEKTLKNLQRTEVETVLHFEHTAASTASTASPCGVLLKLWSARDKSLNGLRGQQQHSAWVDARARISFWLFSLGSRWWPRPFPTAIWPPMARLDHPPDERRPPRTRKIRGQGAKSAPAIPPAKEERRAGPWAATLAWRRLRQVVLVGAKSVPPTWPRHYTNRHCPPSPLSCCFNIQARSDGPRWPD